MELPAATFPGEQPVTCAELHTFLQQEEYVTEQRMRGIVETIVREQIGEFHEMRRDMVIMIDRVTEVASHFDRARRGGQVPTCCTPGQRHERYPSSR